VAIIAADSASLPPRVFLPDYFSNFLRINDSAKNHQKEYQKEKALFFTVSPLLSFQLIIALTSLYSEKICLKLCSLGGFTTSSG